MLSRRPEWARFVFRSLLFTKRKLLIFRSRDGAEGGGMALSAGGGEWTECRERIAVRDAVYGR